MRKFKKQLAMVPRTTLLTVSPLELWFDDNDHPSTSSCDEPNEKGYVSR